MKKIAAVLMMLVCVGFCACQRGMPSEGPAAQSTTVSELSETTTTTTEFTEASRWDMRAHHESWRSKKDDLIKKVKDELTAKGWQNLELQTLGEGRYLFMYTVVGSIDNRYNNPMRISAGMFFSDVSPDGSTDGVSYQSESGRIYYGDEILPPNDPRLYDYMIENGEKWSKNADAEINKIEEELVEKGWLHIEAKLTNEETFNHVYEITGQVDNEYNNPVIISVHIIFNAFAPKGDLGFAAYRSKLDPNRTYRSEKILPANSQQLYDQLNSKG